MPQRQPLPLTLTLSPQKSGERECVAHRLTPPR